MNKKMNNKGFSLVELIVVIAIMGILAVTLAPRLTAYVEKSRAASDKEAIASIYSAAKLANAEFTYDGTSVVLGEDATAATAMFVISDAGKTWTLNNSGTTKYAPLTTDSNAAFLTQLQANLDNFKLKSSDVEAATTITISNDANGSISVVLDYDGSTETTVPEVKIPE